MADADTGTAPAAPKKSDLKARTLSAIVMVAVAGTALWLGGVAWTVFVLLVATGVLWEWNKLSRKIAASWWARALWLVAGVVYVGVASVILTGLREAGVLAVTLPIVAVMSTDIGAYFAGRAFGGPKIAPRISPSKTWSGLVGGMSASGLSIIALMLIVGCRAVLDNDCWNNESLTDWRTALPLGACAAIIAQAGDFFESWMKRRAGVKDSGNLIPGHGGLFDRLDGLLAVLFVFGALTAFVGLSAPKEPHVVTVSTVDMK